MKLYKKVAQSEIIKIFIAPPRFVFQICALQKKEQKKEQKLLCALQKKEQKEPKQNFVFHLKILMMCKTWLQR